jgi:hypothetical protein
VGDTKPPERREIPVREFGSSGAALRWCQILNLTWVLYLRLIILSVGGDVPIDSKTLLVTDFMNLKIKPTQSFRCAHISRMCVRVFIGVSAHTCMSIYVCTVFLKKRFIGAVGKHFLIHILLRLFHMAYAKPTKTS